MGVNAMPIKLSDIKAEVMDRLGQEVVVTVEAGRKKKKERKGIISEAYPAVFIVKLDPEVYDFECVSYSYTDILTDTIELTFNDELSNSK